MSLTPLLNTAEIRALFASELARSGGSVSDTFDDGQRLFVRSILPRSGDVYVGETMHSGVALRSDSHTLHVHPYVFRQLCRNGAIIAHALQSREIEAEEHTTKEELAAAIREAVSACCEKEAFSTAMEEIQGSRSKVADVAINLLPVLSRLRPEMGTQIFKMIVERFFDGEDASRFGLMNAVTSVARDTADPEVRWHLEELGGGIPVGRPPAPEPEDLAAEAAMAN
jgi:hypothetical protein